jgi:hypothetical protein
MNPSHAIVSERRGWERHRLVRVREPRALAPWMCFLVGSKRDDLYREPRSVDGAGRLLRRAPVGEGRTPTHRNL